MNEIVFFVSVPMRRCPFKGRAVTVVTGAPLTDTGWRKQKLQSRATIAENLN